MSIERIETLMKSGWIDEETVDKLLPLMYEVIKAGEYVIESSTGRVSGYRQYEYDAKRRALSDYCAQHLPEAEA